MDTVPLPINIQPPHCNSCTKNNVLTIHLHFCKKDVLY